MRIIEYGPDPGIANVMVSAPGLVLASTIACSRLPTPVGVAVVTLYVAALAYDPIAITKPTSND